MIIFYFISGHDLTGNKLLNIDMQFLGKICFGLVCIDFDYLSCDQAKSVWSRLKLNSVSIFLTNCMHNFHSYILQKTPVKLVNWFQRYDQLKDAKNNRKQKTFSALFGSILKSVFLTSDWFCLITSHLFQTT